MVINIIAEPSSHLEIREVENHSFLVKRIQGGQDDDWLGRVTEHYGKFSAKAEWHGQHTYLTGDFTDLETAVKWLADLQPYSRSQSYYHRANDLKHLERKEHERERRDRPWWYDNNGHHIGV